MPASMQQQPGQPAGAMSATTSAAARAVDPQEEAQSKALAADLLKRIERARKAQSWQDAEKRWRDNRKWLQGIDPSDGSKVRTNLHFANLAAIRPQVYAKDPEFACKPTAAVPKERQYVVQKFGETAEQVLGVYLVQRARLKRRAKRILSSCYTTALGWWKVSWQENRRTDPQIAARIKDTQDNLDRLRVEREALDDQAAQTEHDERAAKLRETLQGLQAQAEVTVARGPVVDFCLPEDILLLDPSVLEIADYERSEAIAQRVWMTREQYRRTFGANPERARIYAEAKADAQPAVPSAGQGQDDGRADLLCVWEVWDQGANRVHTVCEGVEGLCRPSFSPDWTGERWLPFFLLMFNEIDGPALPPSDVDLTADLVREYNRTRDDFARDRKNALPLNVVRKGGALTPGDVDRLTNRQGGDVVVVEGGTGKPLTDDIWSGQLAQVRPENYDTAQSSRDIEMLIGGGDASRGSVLKAKTATEAEILSQGLRGRSAERTDTIEDLLSDVGRYVLEMCLRKLSQADVQEIAGPDAVWPQLTAEQVFRQVTLSVRGGSTGKPDRLQEQDRWTKLLPVVEKAMQRVAELRQAGQDSAAEAVVELVRETMRRFDERVDIERFLPQPEEGQEPGADGAQPEITPEMVAQAKAVIEELQAKVQELEQAAADKAADRNADVEKARIAAVAEVEKAERVARINAAATVEAAQIRAAQPPMVPNDQPAGLVGAVAAVSGEDMGGMPD